MKNRDDDRKQRKGKKPYVAPRVAPLGSVRSLTFGGSSGSLETTIGRAKDK